MIKKTFFMLFFCFTIVHPLLFPALSTAQEPGETFTLKQTIENAIKVNLELQSYKEETKAAMAVKKTQLANFFPTLSATYQYKRNDEAISTPPFGIIGPENEYKFVTSLTQPLFTRFSVLNSYKISSLSLDAARINEKLKRNEVIFEAKNIYFGLLKTQKLLKVAQQTVTQITAQKERAENYYKVGLTPLNDFLQAQVELANTKQDFIVAQNNLEIAKLNFNTLIRRPIKSPVEIEDILDHTPFEHIIDYCLEMAKRKRLEIKIANLEIEIAEKKLALAKKGYYPSINLEANYFFNGTDWDVDGGEGISDPEGWNIAAVASWNFLEWGRSYHGVKEKLSRVYQAKYNKEKILDNINLEVNQAYLKTREAEKNIITIEKAIEQAKENFRISKERYKGQMATSTDVLDAQTLLSKTMTNYYNALYDHKISKAALYWAMGQEIIE